MIELKSMYTFLLVLIGFIAHSQKIVYDQSGVKKSYTKEDSKLELVSKSSVEMYPKNQQNLSPILTALLPPVAGFGLDLLGDAIEKSSKKFTGEYSNNSIYTSAGESSVPNLIFVRLVKLKGKVDYDTAFRLTLKAIQPKNLPGFYFEIDSLLVSYSKAKITKKHKTLDYAIEIIPTFLVPGKGNSIEKKSIELDPISIRSVDFNSNWDEVKKQNTFRTGIIPIPKNSYFIEASIKIVETNPHKVRIDKILSIYDSNKEDLKTIINNYFEEDED